MLAEIDPEQPPQFAYPTEGVRVGINYHNQTIGKHRPRFAFDPPVAKILRRGLNFPAIQIDGTFVNGLRIWCEDGEGMKPAIAHSGGWSFSVPVRRVRGREENIGMLDVPFEWELGEKGPVLLIPRLPDALLPPEVIDKLPNSQVDPETRLDRAEVKLQRDMRRLYEDAVELEAQEAEQPAEPPEPPSAPALDLREALAMVNELVDQLGDGIVLTIDANGHVQAKRRIVQYVDL